MARTKLSRKQLIVYTFRVNLYSEKDTFYYGDERNFIKGEIKWPLYAKKESAAKFERLEVMYFSVPNLIWNILDRVTRAICFMWNCVWNAISKVVALLQIRSCANTYIFLHTQYWTLTFRSSIVRALAILAILCSITVRVHVITRVNLSSESLPSSLMRSQLRTIKRLFDRATRGNLPALASSSLDKSNDS